jgi:hypothetical protein
MPEKKEEPQQRLVAEAVAAMNSLLTDEVLEQIQRGQIRLTAIEEQTLAIRQQVGERITHQKRSQAVQGQQGGVICPECGGQMQNKGNKRARSSSGQATARLRGVTTIVATASRGISPLWDTSAAESALRKTL